MKLNFHGGPKLRRAPWPVRRLFGEKEKAAVATLFDRAIAEGSHLLGYNGEEEAGYCREFAQGLGGGYADGVNSGSNAIYVALRSLDLPPGSEVIVPPVTDPGGVMPVIIAGATPVSVDTAPGSYNTDAAQIAAAITPRTGAILIAHIAGIPVEMGPVLELAGRHGLPVIEDCAQAHGATYRGRAVGAWGEVAAFSTMFGKHHATGGQGGVVFTRSAERYWRVRQVADRGKPFGMEGATANVVATLNCNMDELHAAIGRVQLARLPGFVETRRKLARRLEAALLSEVETIRLVTGPVDGEASYWFFLLKIEPERWCIDKATFARAVVAEGIPLESGYWHVPVTQPWWPGSEASDLSLPNLHAAEATHLMMPLHEGWSEAEVDDLVAALKKVEAYALEN